MQATKAFNLGRVRLQLIGAVVGVRMGSPTLEVGRTAADSGMIVVSGSAGALSWVVSRAIHHYNPCICNALACHTRRESRASRSLCCQVVRTSRRGKLRAFRTPSGLDHRDPENHLQNLVKRKMWESSDRLAPIPPQNIDDTYPNDPARISAWHPSAGRGAGRFKSAEARRSRQCGGPPLKTMRRPAASKQRGGRPALSILLMLAGGLAGGECRLSCRPGPPLCPPRR